MATFQKIFDDIKSAIQEKVDSGMHHIEINLEISASSSHMDLAKNLHYSIRTSKFDGYDLHTCRVRETIEYIWLKNKHVDKDILIQLNIELDRIT